VRDFELITPKGLREASLLLVGRTDGGEATNVGIVAAVAKAGGIDLLDLMKEGILSPRTVVNLLPLEGQAKIEEDPDRGLSIGPLATLAAIAEDARVQARYPLLAMAVGEAATPQLRNVATIGGNLCQRPRCWYFRSLDFPCLKKGGETCFAVEGDNRYHAIFGDGPCHIVSPSSAGLALVALGGTISVVGPEGGEVREREIEAERFFTMPDDDVTRENVLGPSDIVVGVRVPPPMTGAASSYLKIREKETFDWPIAEAAVTLVRDAAGTVVSARIVLGAAAPIPWRSEAAERAILGKPLTEASASAAAEAALEGANPMSGNGYKVGLLREVVRRALLQAE
jgi:xanthine dehydrogenase YagS FAD-binding subunit